MGLFSRAHESKDPEVRLKAVEKLDDQVLLAEMARSDSSPRVRKAAGTKLTDQELLVDVALNGKEIDARIAAVERIDSQAKLAEIIKVRKNFKLMGACFARITDRGVLDAIANDPAYNMSARRTAIEHFADGSFLDKMSGAADKGEKPKTPEEIDALIDRHGGVRLARAMWKFRGSRNAVLALGEIMHRGGEAGDVALEYLAQILAHANEEISRLAHVQLKTIKSAEQLGRLIGMMDHTNLHDRILAVLREIDHPDARQIVEAAEQ